MTEIALRNSSDLAIEPDQSFWSEKQVAALRQLGVTEANNGDLAVFFHQSKRTGLDPFAKQIYMIGRWSREGTKYTIQTGIDGYRLVARRAADQRRESLEYEDTLWCGEDGEWRTVWLSKQPPAAAKVVVLRDGRRFPAVAVWDEFVQTVKDKATGEQKPNNMWSGMPSNQLAKCAEALALRKAFPQDLSGIYTDEEMGHAERTSDGAHVVTSVRSGSERLRAALGSKQQDEPAPPAEELVKAMAERVEEPITPKQLTALNAHLTSDLELTSRDDKLAYLSGALGREIESSKEVTKAEATRLLDTMMGDRNPPAEPTLPEGAGAVPTWGPEQ